jgi:hypothetical protein
MVAGSWPCVAGARFATLTGAKNSGSLLWGIAINRISFLGTRLSRNTVQRGHLPIKICVLEDFQIDCNLAVFGETVVDALLVSPMHS